MLSGEDIVEEGGFACAKVACSFKESVATVEVGRNNAYLSQS
jgi:hypothetical protein